MVAVMLLAVSSFVGPVQPVHPDPAKVAAKGPSFARTVAIYAPGAALDMALTEYHLATFPTSREGNPLLQNRAVRLGVNALFVAGVARYDLSQQRKGRSTKALRIAYIGVQGLIVGWNLRQLHRQSR